MLPTFVIGLREGLEAALIVGIIAAFLRKQGRRDLLRFVFAGVAVAVALCVATGVALNAVSHDLPQRQQEGLETAIGVLAVGLVTYMVVWMRRNSRGLKGQLEGLAAGALGGSANAGRAMIAMAFLAVLREGVETVVFLLAAFDQSASGAGSAFGACLGLVVAVALGYGIYRGGVRINLSKFFRATGLVLVLVAAGILVNALHTAHEAGWLNVGQQGTVDLSGLVAPGSVQASLLTGMLGVQAQPVLIEVVGWLVYLVPVGLYVAWPHGRGPARRTTATLLAATAVVLALAAGGLALAAPSVPRSTDGTGQVVLLGRTALVRTTGATTTLHRAATVQRHGLTLDVYRAGERTPSADGLPSTLTYARVADLNGGHLPIGLVATDARVPVDYTTTVTTSAWIEPRTARVVELRRDREVRVSAAGHPLARPVTRSQRAWTDVAASAAATRSALSDLDREATWHLLAGLAGCLAVAAAVGAVVIRPIS